MGLITFGSQAARELGQRSHLAPEIVAERPRRPFIDIGSSSKVGPTFMGGDSSIGDFGDGLGTGLGIVVGVVAAIWAGNKLLG